MPQAVWMRRWGIPIYPASFSEVSVAFSFSELSSLVYSLSLMFHSSKWINDMGSERAANNKIFQLHIAGLCGMAIPKTIVTSDPDCAIDFRNSVGSVIFKPVSGTQPFLHRRNNVSLTLVSENDRPNYNFGKDYGPQGLMYTRELSDEMLESLNSLIWAPAIFQELIAKKSDIRITYVGGRIFACRIHSQEYVQTKIDFRHLDTVGKLKHEIFEISSDFADKIRMLMSRLGLCFGCLDFIEDECGQLIFLEVNPAGQWLWIEQITGAAISNAIALELAT